MVHGEPHMMKKHPEYKPLEVKPITEAIKPIIPQSNRVYTPADVFQNRLPEVMVNIMDGDIVDHIEQINKPAFSVRDDDQSIETSHPYQPNELFDEEVDEISEKLEYLRNKYFPEMSLSEDIPEAFLYNIPREVYDAIADLDNKSNRPDILNPLFMLLICCVERPMNSMGGFINILLDEIKKNETVVGREIDLYNEQFDVDEDDDDYDEDIAEEADEDVEEDEPIEEDIEDDDEEGDEEPIVESVEETPQHQYNNSKKGLSKKQRRKQAAMRRNGLSQ
jgi:hypothetical protein